MTNHVDEGSLQALLDEEQERDEGRAIREHLAACPACRERFAEIREANEVLASALGLLDPDAAPRPRLVASGPPSTARRPARWRRFGPLRAAAMVAIFAAAASATIPGSPVREWLIGAGRTTVADVSDPGATPAAPAAAPESGVGVDLREGTLEVHLEDAAPGLAVRVVLVDDDRGAVYASGSASMARFSTASGSVTVSGAGAGELRVEIPRSAASATVIAGGAPIVAKEGAELRVLPAAAASGLQVEVVR